jgi:hypothetical protein
MPAVTGIDDHDLSGEVAITYIWLHQNDSESAGLR